MAKKDPKEYGKKFLDELIGLFPEADREAVKGVLARMPEAGMQNVGEHVLRQDDYSESMNGVTTLRNSTEQWRKDLAAWQGTVKAELDEGKAAKERLAAMGERRGTITTKDDDDPDPNPVVTPKAPVVDLSGYVKLTDVQKMVKDATVEAQTYATSYGAYIAKLTASHSKEFDGEVLDTDALVAFCRDNGLMMDRGGYERFVHEKRDVKNAKTREDELKAAEDRGRRLALSESSSALPYNPPTVESGGNQTLSGLGEKAPDKSSAVARAVETYHNETRKRLGGVS